MSKPDLQRRVLLASGGAALLGMGRAEARRPAPQVQINLAGSPPPVPADGAKTAIIPAGADASSRMSVEVLINDRGPYTFVVDSGANRSVVATEAAAALQLPAGPSTDVHGIAGVASTATVQVGSLAVGDVKSRNLQLPIMGAEQLGAQGLLGVDVMKDRLVVMDFALNRLKIDPARREFGSRSLEDPSETYGYHQGIVSVPARYRFGQLTIVDADIEGVRVTAFLDSGSQNTVTNLALKNALFGRQPLLATRTRSVELISATGQTIVGDYCLLPSLRLGGVHITDLGAVFANLHTFEVWRLVDRPAILVGVDVLRHFTQVELDFGRSKVVFHTGFDGAAAGAAGPSA